MAGGAKLTQTGTSMGTLNYMPPEQIRGEPVDQRADVWALGAVLYEMLVGRPAFSCDNEGATIYAILESDSESVHKMRPGLAPGFDSIVTTALAKDPADRYPTVVALQSELGALELDDQPTAHDGEDLSALAQADGQRSPRSEVNPPTGAGANKSIVVIDFTNITKDPAADWLSSGIAETISVDLGKLSSLKVIGRQKVRNIVGAVEVGELDEEQLQDRIITSLGAALKLKVSDSERRRIERPETEDLEAYEYCARARQLTFEMGKEGMEEARGYLEKAVKLDPRYALAYSSLGQLFGMKFIGTTDPRDLEEAIENLEKARELDPELADSFIWSAYAYSRARRLNEALECARRAVELSPESPMGHYFLGTSQWFRAAIEYQTDGLDEGARHLKQVTELAPRYPAGHQILGILYLWTGQYEEAEMSLRRAAEIEESDNFEVGKFLGSIGLLGRLECRRGHLDEADRLLDLALEVLGGTDHVYSPASTALAHCGKADVRFRRRQNDAALRSFRLAREQVAASLRAARALLESKKGYDFSALWMEVPRLDLEPTFEFLQSEPRFRRIKEQLAGRQLLP